jgi:hypothetical protein
MKFTITAICAIIIWFIFLFKLNKDAIDSDIATAKYKAHYYQHKADSLQCRIYEWENHALRMKRIAGVPDSVGWSYATKCVYSIDTKKVLRK